MPRKQLFLPLFERRARTVAAVAEALRRMLDGGDQVAARCREVVRYEEEADTITRDVMIGVRSRFVTPFDRGDIRVLQFGSASLYSLGHGGNDAQKTMGIIAGLLVAGGHLGETFYVPFWVVTMPAAGAIAALAYALAGLSI